MPEAQAEVLQYPRARAVGRAIFARSRPRSELMRVVQRELQSQVRAMTIAARDRIDALVRPLAASQLHAHPEPNGWSVGQVLEHLCLAGDLTEAPAAGMLRAARKDPGAARTRMETEFSRWADRVVVDEAQTTQERQGLSARAHTTRRHRRRMAGERAAISLRSRSGGRSGLGRLAHTFSGDALVGTENEFGRRLSHSRRTPRAAFASDRASRRQALSGR